MKTPDNLERFITAQEADFKTALSEIKNGKKKTHWMWYIFPQIKGLGLSSTSRFYGIEDLNEAEKYLKHPILGARLTEISKILVLHKTNDAKVIFDAPDDQKLKSCMTLFSSLPDTHPVFLSVLNKYFNGDNDNLTLQLLDSQLQHKH